MAELRCSPLSTWELPKLLRSVHGRRYTADPNARERPHYPAILAFVQRNRFATAVQIRRRFPLQLRSDRTARRHLAELQVVRILAVIHFRSVSALSVILVGEGRLRVYDWGGRPLRGRSTEFRSMKLEWAYSWEPFWAIKISHSDGSAVTLPDRTALARLDSFSNPTIPAGDVQIFAQRASEGQPRTQVATKIQDAQMHRLRPKSVNCIMAYLSK